MPLTGSPMLSMTTSSSSGGTIRRDVLLHFREEALRLLDAHPRLRPHVQLELARVDAGKKSWPRSGTSASEAATNAPEAATNARRCASAAPSARA